MHTNSCTSPRLENTRFDGLASKFPKGRSETDRARFTQVAVTMLTAFHM